uniref:Receptor homology region transmembrane domain-and RING domain-containing protein 2-like isoform X2 n=1 Tax=Rhizophora mucronata TaxID=61149 RepID=A0A2P2KS26_RHIMU
MERVDFVVWFLFCTLLARFSLTSANVVLIGNNVTLSFDDVEANFAPTIKGSGVCGVLYLAEPLEACSQLTNKVDKKSSNCSSPFVLIMRGGGCSFEDKVRRAQRAGFKAAVVYDNEDGGTLVAMAGDSAGIKIPAVFVAKTSGELLKKYSSLDNVELWHRRRRERPHSSRVREFHGMSSHLVKAMPSLTFTSVLEDNSTARTCAICLEDYSVGEKLRILPCQHKFHAFCVDSWLTTWRTFCPVCKRDARTSTGDPPASESTPLLSSSPASVASSPVLSSVRSATSSAIQITPELSRSPFHIPSYSSPAYIPQSLLSYHQSHSISASHSSVDLRNMSSQRSLASHLVSPHSLGYPSVSPLNSRYLTAHIPSPSNASPFLVCSSGHQPRPLHCSESASSLSPFASAQSLPEY